MENSFESFFSILGQIATWLTLVIVFLTLKEMQEQRKSSQKPELVIPSTNFFAYIYPHRLEFFPNHKMEDTQPFGDLRLNIYNIGVGSAKDIVFFWNEEEVSNFVKEITKLETEFSIEIEGSMCSIHTESSSTAFNLKSILNDRMDYLVSTSATQTGATFRFPIVLSYVFSRLLYEFAQTEANDSRREGLMNLARRKFTLNIAYRDISNIIYQKKLMCGLIPALLNYADDSKIYCEGRFEASEL